MQIAQESSQDTDGINPPVVEEAMVFDRNDCLNQICGNIISLGIDAAFRTQVSNELIFIVVDFTRSCCN
ncbi:Uncharacterised protein [Streptococcus pneumoniae]|nr:Uncharacterised protein [Streptococcus pneumoniae]